MSNVQLTPTDGVQKFSLKRDEIEIQLESEDGTANEYLIREMTGAQRDMYLKVMSTKASFDGEGKLLKVIDPTGLQTALLGHCLVDKATQKPVDPKFLNGMRTTVQNNLFEIASKLNGLDKGAEQAAKNE